MTQQQHLNFAAKYCERYIASRGRCEVYATLAAYHAEKAYQAVQSPSGILSQMAINAIHKQELLRGNPHATQEMPAISMRDLVNDRC